MSQPVTVHSIVRVQGGDEDLEAALDAAAADGFDLVQLIPTGSGVTTNSRAEGSWLAVLRKRA